MPHTDVPARERLIDAAFDLFEEVGFDATTVDDISKRAGVGRATFFRLFGTKEAVIFPHHEELLDRVDARLSAATPATRRTSLIEASRLVLLAYLEEGERAKRRYRLVQSVPALRSHEIASLRQYQRMFARHLTGWYGDDRIALLRAELTAAAVITAHNVTLRRWLQGHSEDPLTEFDEASRLALTESDTGLDEVVSVFVVRSSDPDAVAQRVRAALDEA